MNWRVNNVFHYSPTVAYARLASSHKEPVDDYALLDSIMSLLRPLVQHLEFSPDTSTFWINLLKRPSLMHNSMTCQMNVGPFLRQLRPLTKPRFQPAQINEGLGLCMRLPPLFLFGGRSCSACIRSQRDLLSELRPQVLRLRRRAVDRHVLERINFPLMKR